MPPAIQESNAKHYKSDTITERREYEGYAHLLPAQKGWEGERKCEEGVFCGAGSARKIAEERRFGQARTPAPEGARVPTAGWLRGGGLGHATRRRINNVRGKAPFPVCRTIFGRRRGVRGFAARGGDRSCRTAAGPVGHPETPDIS